MLDVSPPAMKATDFIAPLPPRAITSISAFKATRPALEAALGVTLPSTPRKLIAGGVTYLWNGPNAWLALGDVSVPEDVAVTTDQSDGLFLFAVSGPFAAQILKKLVPIDVESFGPGDVAITLAAHIGVRLWREDDAFIVACFRGFAVALHHALAEASHAFSPGRG